MDRDMERDLDREVDRDGDRTGLALAGDRAVLRTGGSLRSDKAETGLADKNKNKLTSSTNSINHLHSQIQNN